MLPSDSGGKEYVYKLYGSRGIGKIRSYHNPTYSGIHSVSYKMRTEAFFGVMFVKHKSFHDYVTSSSSVVAVVVLVVVVTVVVLYCYLHCQINSIIFIIKHMIHPSLRQCMSQHQCKKKKQRKRQTACYIKITRKICMACSSLHDVDMGREKSDTFSLSNYLLG